MNLLSGTGRTRTISLVVGTVGLLLVGAFVLFRPPTPPQEGSISEECWQQLEAQQLLGQLAVRSLETYGRLDPGLFDVSSDPKKVSVSPGAVPTAPGDEPLQRFAGALQVVNGAPALVQRLREGHALALKSCSERCPPKPYAFEVELVKEARNPDAAFYKWRVKGEVPTNAEWEQGFLNLYGGAPKLSCSEYTVLDVSRGYGSKTASNMAGPIDGPGVTQESRALTPAANRGKNDESDPSERDITEGSAAAGSGCNSNPHNSCDLCWLTRTIPSGYYWNGARWCCGGC
jgi:hypothetical protein